MPKLRVSPEEERDRAILGQISQKTWLKYGKKMSGERVVPKDRRFRWDTLDQTYLGGV